MFNNQELSALSQSQLDKAARLSSIVLSSAERFTNLHLDLSRQLLSAQTETIKAFAAAKDPKAFGEVQNNMAQPSIDQALSVARHVYDAALSTQNEIVAFMEEQISEGNKTLLNNLDRLSKNAPAGSDVAVTALKTLVNTSTAAFESASKTAKKVSTEFAEASVEAANNSAKAASAAVARTKKAASAA
ncbi:phasin family protein [Neisseriaceae bacterium TC5R-5]|nr:phasin family protein [Neisseriaceae bacterium TC5R-5]